MSNNENQKKVTIDISPLLILKIIAILLILGFLYLVLDIILVLFIALIISSAIIPWVDSLEKRKIPRFISIVFIYLVILSILSLAVILIVPPITLQLGQLANNLPNYYNQIFRGLEQTRGISIESAKSLQSILQSWGEGLAANTSTIISTLGSIFGGLLGLIIALVITFYITSKKDSINKFLQSVTPPQYHIYVIQLSQRIQSKLGAWVKSQLLLSFIVGLLCFIGLEIIGVKYALILGLIAAITEVIPYLGPLLGAIPAVILAFVQSPIKAVWVAVLYILVQQLENSFLVPGVIKRAVGLNPIITIVAIAIGGKLAGIGGAIIAVPLVVVLDIVVINLFNIGKEKEVL